MKKFFILIAVFSVFSMTAFGQGFSWGLKGGVSNATVAIETGGDTFPTSTEYKSGAVAGAFLRFDLIFLGLQVDALYAQKGYAADIGGVKGDITLNYLSIPVVAKWDLFPAVVKPYLAGGLEYSYLLDASSGVSGVTVDKDDFESSDFGIVAAAGVDFGVAMINMGVDLRYIYGLNNVAKFSGSPNVEVKNQAVQITIALAF